MFRRCATLAVALLPACYDPPVETPPNHVYQDTPISVPQNKGNQVDVLFMIDNSSSMDPMQTELQKRFAQFLQVFQDEAAKGRYIDLHVGVVTSDYGAGATGAPGCDKGGGGQGGRLQAMPAPGATAPVGCKPPVSGNFVAYDFDPKGAGSNLPPGQDLAQTFTCMASVGSGGCGFEHPLESVFAALHDEQTNAGFVRPDALLAVVFVTNEDDASAPADTDIWDLNKPQYGAMSTYRQTRFGVACGDPLALTPYDSSHGPLAGCIAAPDGPDGAGPGREYDVGRYIHYFNSPHKAGGVKVNPSDQLILVGIDAPVPAVGPEIILSTGNDPVHGVIDYPPCNRLDETSNPKCLPWLQHSCHVGNFFGDPAVRLDQVINAATNHVVKSICDTDYSQSLQDIAAKINYFLPSGCIKAPLANPMNPDCVVEDHTINGDDSETITLIPRCDQAPAGATCWRVEEKTDCKDKSPQSLGVTIDRQGQPAPPRTTALVSCNTVAN
jgi:hypothetical protein